MSRLPVELVLQIVDSLVSFPHAVPVALAPSHPTTKTLLSLCQVCRAVYPTALRHLYTHCLYIDSSARLSRLLQSLPFPLSSHHPLLPILPHIHSLYLSPFNGPTIDDLPLAKWVFDLLTTLAPYLRRLVIDIPLRSLYPDEDHLSVRPILRSAFLRLTELEEFTSARDQLYLNITEPGPWLAREDEVWTQWPKLKRLALYNPEMSSMAMKVERGNSRRGCSQLETLVVTRADGLMFPIPVYFRLDDERQRLKVVVANTESWHQEIEMGRGETYTDGAGSAFSLAKRRHYKGRVEVVKFTVPDTGIEDPIEDCQVWMRDQAIEGTLWDCEGELLKG